MAEKSQESSQETEIPILSRLRPPVGAVTKKLRVGRGPGSGLGKTAGRGQKGQKARQPGNIHKLHFEGGQMPLNRRLPKVGFNSLFPVKFAEINVSTLDKFEAGTTVNQAALRERGFVKGQVDGVKILGSGELTKKLIVEAEAFSASAKAKIEALGGTVTVIEKKIAPVVRHKNKAPKARKAP